MDLKGKRQDIRQNPFRRSRQSRYRQTERQRKDIDDATGNEVNWISSGAEFMSIEHYLMRQHRIHSRVDQDSTPMRPKQAHRCVCPVPGVHGQQDLARMAHDFHAQSSQKQDGVQVA